MSALVVRAAAIIAITAGWCSLPASGQPNGTTPTCDNPDPAAVSGIDSLRRLFSIAQSRRIDFAIIGDSNTRLGAAASGHENAMARAFAARFGMYATRVEPASPIGGWGQLTTGQGGGACCYQYITDPAANAFCFPNLSFPCFPGVGVTLPPGATISPYNNFGMQLFPDCPLGIESALRYHLTHFLTTSATPGFITPSARENYPGNLFHNYASSPSITTTDPTPHIADISMDVPAGARAASGIMFCLVDSGSGFGAVGPATPLWNRVENTARTSGIAYSPLWAQGGKSSRYALLTLQTANVQAATTEWFRQATRLQGAAPALCIQILHGGNDCFDFEPSLGPVGGINSSTGPGHEDNLRGIISLLRSWWVAAGYDSSNLFFLLGPYHPRPGEDNPLQLAFEDALRSIAASDTQIIAVAGNRLSTPEEFASRGYLLNGNDIAHLSASGYTSWATATVRALDLALQPADFNGDHITNVSDIFAYIAAFFANAPTADFNHSGDTGIEDIFDFLAAWFSA